MASAALKEELTCSICLNIYTDPVTLRCGHSFCQECIENVLKTQLASSRPCCCSCPECRAEFQEFPLLQKNVSLQNIARHFLSIQPEKSAAEILCTYCIQSHVPAVKSCLLCEASLCDGHLKLHSKSTEHVLIEPTTSIGNRKCPKHDQGLLYYCTVDASCVCVSCTLTGEHKGHHIESLKDASKKKKESLRELLGHLISKRQETNRSLQTLQDLKTDVPKKAAGIKDKVTGVLRDMRRELDLLEKKLYCELSSQEEKALRSFSDRIEQLELKKDKLSKKIHRNEELYNMADPLELLQVERCSFSDVETTDNKILERFQWHQASTRSFSKGKHYWEVEVGKVGIFRLGVSYATVERQGGPSFLGNDQSWGLRRRDDKYAMYYNKESSVLPHKPSSQRLAMYLDYEAGHLSFYELTNSIRHLHTTKTTFTKPVHLGFLLFENCWLRIVI
ncbi:E3 ubiquitin/ISG15 ligase TRIM25-like [Leptodactylus fuscus]